MSDEVNYQENWNDEQTQCKNCKSFQAKDGKNACVPEDMDFEKAIEEHGEVSPAGHYDGFKKSE